MTITLTLESWLIPAVISLLLALSAAIIWHRSPYYSLAPGLAVSAAVSLSVAAWTVWALIAVVLV